MIIFQISIVTLPGANRMHEAKIKSENKLNIWDQRSLRIFICDDLSNAIEFIIKIMLNLSQI